MSDDNSSLRRGLGPWYSVTALLAAAFAILGLSPNPPPKVSDPNTKATSSDPTPTGLVSFPARIWDDPFDQLAQAQQLLAKANQSSPNSSVHVGPNGNLDSLQEILLQRIFETHDFETLRDEKRQDTKLLLVLNLVPGKMTSNEIESRLCSRHVQEIAFSLYGFRPILPDRLSFVQLPKVETYFSNNHRVSTSPAIPIKLYENPSTKQFILNLWFDQSSLGQKPWHCIHTILESICTSGKYAKQIQDLLMSRSFLAVSGPQTSDVLKQMEPAAMSEDKEFYLGTVNMKEVFPAKEPGASSDAQSSELRLFSKWRGICWQVSHCSVPIEQQWPKLMNSPSQIDESQLRNTGLVPIKIHFSIPDDRELLEVLADELQTRLGDFAGSSRQILLFVEQDRSYGRFLGEQLKKQMLQSGSFRFVTIPYLREIGATKSGEETKETAIDLPRPNVSDYFERTLDTLNSANSEIRKPAAIGVLGGSWQDKVALIRDVRYRFPQSLCFTNDFDCRFADPALLPFTRNLLIASHGDPMPRVISSQGDVASISFRTEYQSTDLIGFADLFEKAFRFQQKEREKPLSSQGSKQSSPKIEPEGKTQARIYEVTNSGFVGMPLRKEENTIANPVRPLLAPLLGCLSIFLLMTFPLFHSWVQSKFKKFLSKRSQDPWVLYFQDNWGSVTNSILKNTSSSLAFFVTSMICVLPAVTLQECSKASIFHWGVGVSVIPSILLLALTIPFTFRPTNKSEQFSNSNPDSPIIDSNRAVDSSAPSRDEQLRFFERLIQKLGQTIGEHKAAHQDHLHVPNIRRRNSIGILISVVVLCLGFFIWYWTTDCWILQIGLLGLLAFSLKIRRTMVNATYITLAIGLGIGWVRYVANDYEIVPARDAWIRAVGSTCFVVAYWWLLIGLVKLTLYQRRLRTQLRVAGQWMDRLHVEKRSILLETAKAIDVAIVETGKVSNSISHDLGLLAGLGLVICVARIPLLDAWGMSLATWLTIVLPMAIPFLFAIVLRRRAWRFRESAIQYMLRAKREFTTSVNQEAEANEINEIQSLIKSFDIGVFAPLDRDPLVSAGLALLLAFCSGPNSDILRRIISFVVL